MLFDDQLRFVHVDGIHGRKKNNLLIKENAPYAIELTSQRRIERYLRNIFTNSSPFRKIDEKIRTHTIRYSKQ